MMDHLADAAYRQLGQELLAATLLATLCIIIHGLGLALITKMIRPSDDPNRVTHLPPVSVHGILITIVLVLTLFVIHGVEIWLFALFYLFVDALPDLSSALYFSTISYSTVGYNDELIETTWRNVGALESISGVILLGWSTAYFVRILGHIDYKRVRFGRRRKDVDEA